MTFSGLTSEARDFFVELAENNNRDFFTAHRDVYDRAIRAPMEALLGEAGEVYGPGTRSAIDQTKAALLFCADKADSSKGAGDVSGARHQT